MDDRKKKVATKMHPDDSEVLRKFTRKIDGRELFEMPEGIYKRVKDRYIRQHGRMESVFH